MINAKTLFDTRISDFIYQLTWTDKIKKINIIAIQPILGTHIGMTVKDSGLLIFKNTDYKIQKGNDWFYIGPAKLFSDLTNLDTHPRYKYLNEQILYWKKEMTAAMAELDSMLSLRETCCDDLEVDITDYKEKLGKFYKENKSYPYQK